MADTNKKVAIHCHVNDIDMLVSQFGAANVMLQDANGLELVFKTDQSGSEIALPVTPVMAESFQLNRRLMRFIGSRLNPSVASSAEDLSITFTDTTGFVVGNEVFIRDASTGLEEPDVNKITAVTATQLTFDGPLENDYTTSATVDLVSSNLASVAGTLASPQLYTISPLTNEEWHIDRVLIHLESTAAMDDSKFGSAAALTNGVFLFKTILSTPFTQRLANWKSNGSLAHLCYDVRYVSKSGGGLFSVVARWSFNKHQIAHELEGANGDTLGALIQDDFTANSHMHIVVQGHREQE
ncbi:MAG: hypothetical protein KAT00_13780 [Planctomycetes bacterium]|nr:hypothetical protein [Planctomycetota bacterium]